MGCPIRISSDQCLLAAPQGFSQRVTSFIASMHQGIHQMPLRRLISTRDQKQHDQPDFGSLDDIYSRHVFLTVIQRPADHQGILNPSSLSRMFRDLKWSTNNSLHNANQRSKPKRISRTSPQSPETPNASTQTDHVFCYANNAAYPTNQDSQASTAFTGDPIANL